jgi:uncharacterized membrane protein YjgN (DUF898 family)
MGNYQIVYNSIMLTMDKQEVVEAFSRLFKLSPEKASAILDNPQTVIRSNLDSVTAERYREKLLAIGIDVDVRDMSVREAPVLPVNQRPLAPVQPLVLELSPIEKKATYDGDSIARYQGNRTLGFDFYGSGFEYFPIWITNILFTVLTLGIYSAWATVRTRQYFYKNITLENAPFQYLATPLQILRWRIAGIVSIVLFIFLVKFFSVKAAMFFLLLLLLILPALMVAAFAAHMRAIAWRNVVFNCSRDLDSHATYGNVFISTPSSVGSYCLLYFFKLPLLSALILLLAAAILFAVMGNHLQEQIQALESMRHTLSTGMPVLLESGAYIAASTTVLVTVVGGCWLAAYIQACLFKLRYNGLALGKTELSCHARARSLLWLYLSNTVAILLSAGLFIPWARVRMVRYRLSCLTLYASYELDDIIGKAQQGSTADGVFPDLYCTDIQ